MGTVLTSSTESFGGLELPSLGAFQVCFLLGAAAAFVGVAIAAAIPRRTPVPAERVPAAA
jgi:hypothetical protein